MPTRRKATVVASTSGTNAKGEPVIAPNSVLVCREDDGPKRFYHRLVVDSVRFKLNSIWDRMFAGVTLPTELIFRHVEFDPVMIRHWLNCNEADLGGLMFPGTFIDVESKAPRIRILKYGPTRAKSASIHADLSLHLFRREIEESPALQPFDPAVWDLEEAYGVWCYMHEEMAVVMEEECDSHRGRSHLLLRRLPNPTMRPCRSMTHTAGSHSFDPKGPGRYSITPFVEISTHY